MSPISIRCLKSFALTLICIGCAKPFVRDPDFSGVIETRKMSPVPPCAPLLVILWNPHRPDHPAPDREAVEKLIFGKDASVAGWFSENSGGRFRLQKAAVLGWYDSAKSGEHYWSTNSRTDPNDSDGDGWLSGHAEKWAEAVRRADADFDFVQYDRNKNGILETHELGILMAIPQKKPFGTVRRPVGRQVPQEAPLVVDGVTIPSIAEWYTGLPANLGAAAHELCHLLLGSPDMYLRSKWPHVAGSYSLMDRSYAPVHLDPFEKLKLGWLRTEVVQEGGEYKLPDVETNGKVIILYNPKRGLAEYFILENRYAGTSYEAGGEAIGRGLPQEGLAIWHIIEDPKNLREGSRPEGVSPKDWGRSSIRLIRSNGGEPRDDRKALFSTPGTTISETSTPAKLTWVDGSPTGFSITLLTPPGPELRVRIDTREQTSIE